MTENQNRTLLDKFMLRFPDGMRERIKVAASENNRSMNAEIIDTLEEKYPDFKEPMDKDNALALIYSMARGSQESHFHVLKETFDEWLLDVGLPYEVGIDKVHNGNTRVYLIPKDS